MKKSLSLLLAAALICTLAAGCGTEEALVQTAPPTEVPAPLVLEDTPEVKQYEGVKLTFHSRWGEDALDAGVLTQAAELFEATTGAVVEIQWQAGEGGDIFQLPASQLSQCHEQVLDLTQMAQAAGYESRSIECLVDLARSGEVLLAIPQTPYVSGFYYNRAVFEACGITEMPGTYDEFLNLCAALAAGGYSPLTLDTESADELLALHLTQYLGAEGAAQMLAKGGWTEDELALQATVDIWDFVKAGYLTYATPAAYPAGQNRIGSSNSAMVYGTNALCAQVEAQTMTEISWGMFPYPGVAGAERIISVDADVLAIKKFRSNVELYLRKDGGWTGDATPYIKIIFKNVSQFDREKGFALRPKLDAHGELGTSCKYLYDELYRVGDGYEVHMLFWTPKALRYLTIRCEDIQFEDNIALESVPQGGQR